MGSQQYKATTFFLFIATIVACLLDLLQRTYLLFAFDQSIPPVSSHSEIEAIYSLWNYLHNDIVYTDRTQIPFASSYFNWLFYAIYGGLVKLVLNTFSLSDNWLPYIARLISLAFTIGSFLLAKTILKELRANDQEDAIGNHLVLWCFIIWPFVLALFGPPVIVAIRPDIGATFFQLLGLLSFIRSQKTERPNVYLTALWFYCAWALKQTQVAIIIACFFFCLIKRQVSSAVTLLGVFFALTVITLFVGSPLYLDSIIFAQANMSLSVWHSSMVVGLCFFMAPIIAFILALTVTLLKTKNAELSANNYLLMWCFLIDFIFSTVLSLKVGAHVNYFFLSGILAIIVFLSFLQRKLLREHFLFVLGFSLFIWQILMLSNVRLGNIFYSARQDVQEDLSRLHTLRTELVNLPSPIFVEEQIGNSPWVHSQSPHFVVVSGYWFDHKAGRSFQSSGLDGLIRQGWFGTVVADFDKSWPETNNGFSDNYSLLKEKSGYFFYVKKYPPTASAAALAENPVPAD